LRKAMLAATIAAEFGWCAAGAVMLLVTPFFRRRREGKAASAQRRPESPPPSASTGASAPASSASRSAARPSGTPPPVPEYYEGPPEPRRPSPGDGSHIAGGRVAAPDLDTLMAQLDHLHEQMQRKRPAPRGGVAEATDAGRPAEP
jgi:hypothetical protein